MKYREICPVCERKNIISFFSLSDIPVANNVLCQSYAEAIAFKTGKLDFVVCSDCGFAWNIAYNPTLLKYDETYENNQSISRAFQDHINTVVSFLPVSKDHSQIVEVGCGQGYFLQALKKKLSGLLDSAIGFDPALREGNEDLGLFQGLLDSTRFPKGFLPQIFVSRHVIEHINDVNLFMSNVCENIPSAQFGVLETPSLEWIVEKKAYYDMYYEHCSLFTASSLNLFLQKFGFGNYQAEILFDGQYLLAVGQRGLKGSKQTLSKNYLEKVKSFGTGFSDYKQQWANRLTQLKERHKRIGVWGGASKGVNFLHHMRTMGISLDCVVDINPQKQGKFMPGCGTPILSPEKAWDLGCNVFVVANPNYCAEIKLLCTAAGMNTTLIPLE